MSHSNVCHNFAHDSETGKASGNMFYEGTGTGSTLYSYGYHFGIATKIGPEKAIFTLAEYSVSTAKHKHHAGSALSHYDLIMVPRPTQNYELDAGGNLRTYNQSENLTGFHSDLKYFEDELIDLAGKHHRARKYSYVDLIKSTAELAREFCELFKIPGRIISGPLNDVLTASDPVTAVLGTDWKEVAAAREAANKKREAAARKKALKEWRAGKNVYIQSKYTYLRLRGDILETSKHIRIDVNRYKTAIYNLLDLAYLCKKRAKSVECNEIIAGYNIDRIDESGNIYAGCHLIRYDEIKRIQPEITKLVKF